MDTSQLEKTVSRMMAHGKGILAMDESTGTITKRMQEVGVVSTPEKNREFRSILVTSPGIENFISGVIMYEETLRQKVDGTDMTFPEYLESKGIVPGIKVDKGKKDMAGFPGEFVTIGLDGLRNRFKEYYDLGARFSKWRAEFHIDDENGLPSFACVDANDNSLVRYANIAQEQSIAPIQEPEVMMTGNHSNDICYNVTAGILEHLFGLNKIYGVYLPGIVLKPNMILAGKDYSLKPPIVEAARGTYNCLKKNVPEDVGGIAFLSGGMSDEDSALNLNALNRHYSKESPWRTTFSYGRALQREAMAEWGINPQNVDGIQRLFLEKARTYGLASEGKLE